MKVVLAVVGLQAFFLIGLESVSGQGASLVDVFGVEIGQPGNFRLLRDGNQTRTDILMDQIIELDENRSAVGTERGPVGPRSSSGGPGRTGPDLRHSFFSFAGLSFSFSEVEVNNPFESVSPLTASFNFIAFLPAPNSTLNVRVILFLEPQQIRIGGEFTEVTRGTFAFSIEILNWDFCDGTKEVCRSRGRGTGRRRGRRSRGNQGETGDAIDFTITLSERRDGGYGGYTRGPSRGRGRGSRNRDTVPLALVNQIAVDGVPQQMEDGFPSVRVRGYRTYVTFRFPLFNDTVVYAE